MFDLVALIKAVGYLGIFAIVFAESGLFIGFFLPGDSLLFTAGFLASQGLLEIKTLIILVFTAAVIGDSFGYAFGRRIGPAIFKKEDSLFFHRKNLERANLFYQRHGGRTIILARFIPVVRTFAPILAGAGRMRYSSFLFFNIFGGALWSISLSFLGFYLGRSIPDIDKYLLPIIALIIFVSVLPNVIHVLRHREDRERIKLFAAKLIRKK